MSDIDQLEWALSINTDKQNELREINVHGWKALQNESQAIGPYFTNQIMERIHKAKAVNIIIVGEAGVWKSYCAAQIARHISKKFSIDLVVYGYSAYYEALISRKYGIGVPIMLDEPQDAIDHREWYKEAQQAIVKTITSQRFMGKPLLIPIINPSLIDKTIRNYLVQYQIECTDRGFARVFRISPSQKEDKTYYNFMCNLRYGLMDNDQCKNIRCQTCKDYETCPLFRAQYERKKEATQYRKYEQLKQDALIKESKDLTLDQIFEVAYPLRTKYSDDQKIDVKKLRIVLRENGVHIGHNKAYDLKTLLEYRYPDDFKGNT